jgi:hypothetical protein
MDFVRTSQNEVYLDAAGSALYTISQIKECYELLEKNSFVNPHSVPDGFQKSQRLEKVRERVLEFFGASKENYDVVFTSGATAGLKLIGDNFLWTNNSGLIYLTDCHTSALGIIVETGFLRVLLGFLTKAVQKTGLTKVNTHCLFILEKATFVGLGTNWIFAGCFTNMECSSIAAKMW